MARRSRAYFNRQFARRISLETIQKQQVAVAEYSDGTCGLVDDELTRADAGSAAQAEQVDLQIATGIDVAVGFGPSVGSRTPDRGDRRLFVNRMNDRVE